MGCAAFSRRATELNQVAQQKSRVLLARPAAARRCAVRLVDDQQDSATWLGNHVLEFLERTNFHDIAGRLGLEGRLFLGERIDALAFLGGRLVLNHDLA